MRDVSPPPSRSKFLTHTITTLVLIIVLYGVSFSTPTLRHVSNGIDTVQKLLLDKEPKNDEVEVQDTSITHQRYQKVDYYKPPMWSCKDTDRKKKLIFVHIFKTAGKFSEVFLESIWCRRDPFLQSRFVCLANLMCRL